MGAVDRLPRETFRPIKRWEYDRLIGLGTFDREPIELLYGRLVRKMTQNPPHSAVIQFLTNLLPAVLAGRAWLRVQSPFAASDESEPEPDLAIVPPGDYQDGHPEQAHLVIEVAGSSLVEDRDVKAPLYAESGVPEYWLVNLVDRRVEVYRAPKGGKYTKVTRHGAGQVVRMLAFPDVELRVDDLLPRRSAARPRKRR